MTTPYYNAGNGPVVVQGTVVNAASAAADPYGKSSSTSNNNNNQYYSAHNDNPSINAQDQKAQEQPRRCQDVFWGILFFAHLGVMAVLTATYAPTAIQSVAESVQENGGGRSLRRMLRSLQEEDDGGGGANDDGGGYNYNGDETLQIDPKNVLVILSLAGLVGFVISTCALGFMMTFADTLIKMALWFNIILFGVMAAFSALGGALPAALMALVMCGFSAYYAYRVWDRIPFAAANLVTAVTAVRANLGLAFYAYTSLIILFGWSLWWGVTASSVVMVVSACDEGDEDCQPEVNGVIMFLLLLSYYWSAQVISNIVHVTTAGTVGTWWFAPHEANGCCSSAVRQSYIRSITYSFGSICLGSLIVAIIQALKEMVRQARESDDNMLACVAECILGCIESIVEYFNKWAFVYVGLYGFSFIESGKQVINLFKSRGWTSIIADTLVDTVLFMVAIGVGVLTGIVAVILATVMSMNSGVEIGMAFVLGLFIGYGMSATLFAVVSSAVNTVIVCYAEAPNEFQANHPELSEKMRGTWSQAWPSEFAY